MSPARSGSTRAEVAGGDRAIPPSRSGCAPRPRAAIERGIFGSPFIIVDGEPFWGNDRLDDVRDWLKTGGW